jgi:hypothetical protein
VVAIWGFPRREKGLTPLLGVEPDSPPIENPERGPAIDLADEPQKVFVSVNTFIPRPDLGPNAYTFVAASERVPPEAVPYM